MSETSLPRLTRILGEQLAESVRMPLPAHTRRRTFGRVRLPGKATAIVGMRRAGKTTFRGAHGRGGAARLRVAAGAAAVVGRAGTSPLRSMTHRNELPGSCTLQRSFRPLNTARLGSPRLERRFVS